MKISSKLNLKAVSILKKALRLTESELNLLFILEDKKYLDKGLSILELEEILSYQRSQIIQDLANLIKADYIRQTQIEGIYFYQSTKNSAKKFGDYVVKHYHQLPRYLEDLVAWQSRELM